MLTIEPEPCSRIVGNACLADSQALLRLTAKLRSNASSVSRSAGASPSAMEAPTLLCRTSIRPSLERTVSNRLVKSSSLVASAWNGVAAPDSASINEQVAVAEARSRSTHTTCAPSRASRMAVARPLPMVSPGVWPAPTTIAIFPATRPGMLTTVSKEGATMLITRLYSGDDGQTHMEEMNLDTHPELAAMQ